MKFSTSLLTSWLSYMAPKHQRLLSISLGFEKSFFNYYNMSGEDKHQPANPQTLITFKCIIIFCLFSDSKWDWKLLNKSTDFDSRVTQMFLVEGISWRLWSNLLTKFNKIPSFSVTLWETFPFLSRDSTLVQWYQQITMTVRFINYKRRNNFIPQSRLYPSSCFENSNFSAPLAYVRIIYLKPQNQFSVKCNKKIISRVSRLKRHFPVPI